FQIDYQLEFCRLLDRQIGGLGTLQDLVDITGDATPNVKGNGAIGYQSAVVDELTQAVHCREVMCRGELNDAFAVREEDHVSINDQSIRRSLTASPGATFAVSPRRACSAAGWVPRARRRSSRVAYAHAGRAPARDCAP